MARSITVGTLVTRCKARARKTNDDSIETSEWKSMISELYGELHKVVVEKGASYFETEATITATGAASYALPADHLSTLTVSYVVDAAGRRRPLRRVRVQDRAELSGLTGTAYAYALAAANIVLYPLPSSGSYKHLYVPQPTDYSSAGDSTTIDLINIDGEKFVTWGVAAIALHTGDENQQRAMIERDKAYAELEYWATLRALVDPMPRYDESDDDYLIDPADWRFR